MSPSRNHDPTWYSSQQTLWIILILNRSWFLEGETLLMNFWELWETTSRVSPSSITFQRRLTSVSPRLGISHQNNLWMDKQHLTWEETYFCPFEIKASGWEQELKSFFIYMIILRDSPGTRWHTGKRSTHTDWDQTLTDPDRWTQNGRTAWCPVSKSRRSRKLEWITTRQTVLLDLCFQPNCTRLQTVHVTDPSPW